MKHLRNLPELFFVGVLSVKLFKNLFQTGGLDYIALLIIWLLLLQFVYKSRWLGIIYGNLLAAFSIYSIGLLFYSYSFADSSGGKEVLYMVVNLFVYGLSVFMSGKMLYNYYTAKENCAENEFTVSF